MACRVSAVSWSFSNLGRDREAREQRFQFGAGAASMMIKMPGSSSHPTARDYRGAARGSDTARRRKVALPDSLDERRLILGNLDDHLLRKLFSSFPPSAFSSLRTAASCLRV
jgi:hypothetical protein